MGLLILKAAEEYVSQVEKGELTSEQFFIDWLDSLNEISVKY